MNGALNSIVAKSLCLVLTGSTLLSLSVPAIAQAKPSITAEQLERPLSLDEQRRALRRLKEQIAKLPDIPAPSADEPAEVRDKREKMAKLVALVREIEQRIEPSASQKKMQALSNAYYARLMKRVERESTKNLPALSIAPLRGRANVILTIATDGQLVSVSTEDATSAEFGDYAIAFFKQLAPFEPLGTEIRRAADQLIICATFVHGPQ